MGKPSSGAGLVEKERREVGKAGDAGNSDKKVGQIRLNRRCRPTWVRRLHRVFIHASGRSVPFGELIEFNATNRA